jgi:hypothetical protein
VPLYLGYTPLPDMTLYEAELALHVDRSGFVASLWGSAHQHYIDKMPTNGWDNVDGEFRINWFEGEQLLAALGPALHVDDDDEDYIPLPTELESSDENDTDDDGDNDLENYLPNLESY